MERFLVALSICALLLGAACSPISRTAKQELAQPVNCRTAEGDIRVLNHEKAHVEKQVASGIMAVTPAGIVTGVVTGTEVDKIQVATGDYDRQIDRKIAEIKRVCGL